jgi:hypothetical protein
VADNLLSIRGGGFLLTRAERERRRQEWEGRIAAYKSSGRSAAAWCADHGVKVHQLRYRLRQEGGKPDSTRVAWLRAPADEPARDGVLLVRVGAGVIEVRPGFDPDLLLQVARALSAAC